MKNLLLVSVIVGFVVGVTCAVLAMMFGFNTSSPLLLSACVGGVSGVIGAFVAKSKRKQI